MNDQTNNRWTNRVVVVTGASAGIGRATTREFARRGAKLALIARGIDGLRAAQKEVESYGTQALIFPLDVSDAAAVESAAEEIETQLGPIDVWVNNAMLSVFSPVWSMKAEEYRRVTEVTYLGYVYGTLAALRRMRGRDRGCILQVSSALAHRSIPLQSAYCAAKHAIAGFTESLRCELIHDHSNVKVTSVLPPAVNTPQFTWVRSRLPNKAKPVGRIYQPEVLARAVVWAAENYPRELSVGMPTLLAVIGEKFIPGYLDHKLAHDAWEGQQTDEPAPPRADNLWNPVPGDHGARGPFNQHAHEKSVELYLRQHRGALITACAATLCFIVGLAMTH